MAKTQPRPKCLSLRETEKVFNKEIGKLVREVSAELEDLSDPIWDAIHRDKPFLAQASK